MDASIVNRFSKALDQKAYLDFSFQTGKWSESSIFNRVNEMINGRFARISHMTEQLSLYLDYCERFPVCWDSEGLVDFDKYESIQSASNKMLKQCIGMSFYWQFKRRVVALEYRLMQKRDAEEEEDINEELLEYAERWKEEQWQLKPEEKKLSEADLNALQVMQEQYPESIEIILNDRGFRVEAFKWLFRYGNGVDVLAEFPRTQQRIKNANLASRISYLGKSTLKIRYRKKGGLTKKVVTLPFTLYEKKKTQHISLLDEAREVRLECNWKLTIEKILDICRRKSIEPGKIEFFAHGGGFQNWDSHGMGLWKPRAKVCIPIDFSKKNWWRQLPIEAKLNRKQVKAYFSKYCSEEEREAFENAVQKKAPFIAPRATRSTPDRNMDGCHAFLLIGMWNKELSKYALYNFGLYPEGFPISAIGYLWFFTAPNRARMQFPDDNIHFSHREHKIDLQPTTMKVVKKLMTILKREIQSTLNYEELFIWPSHSCATKVNKIMTELKETTEENLRIPNFERPILSASPRSFWAVLIKLFSPLPIKWQNRMLALLFFLLGGFRGKIVKGKKLSYYNSDYWPTNDHSKQATVQIPSFSFHEKKEKKEKS